ncbi:MAG: hypothetical protein H6668_15130 [Ardenticatenaceae bacterium]|nr:hypothetical protein [Ardenticatenaceae bacterium]
MANDILISQGEFSELVKRVEWLDEERRKSTRKLAELEQRIQLQEREISGREQRIQDLERQLAATTAQLSRIPQVDVQLEQFKDDMVEMIEQYDQRRLNAEEELDRLRRIEHESVTREIIDIRKELPAISRLQHEMELRKSEEARLSNLIGTQTNRLSALNNQVESWPRDIAFLDEKEKQNSRNIADMQNTLLDINRRWEPLNDRIEITAQSTLKFQGRFKEITDAQEVLRDMVREWAQQMQMGEHERNKRLEAWRYAIEEQSQTIERFKREWITFSDQYKEAKMAVQTMAPWQSQIEQQQREASELLRVETHRMQSRWDSFGQEVERRLKNFDLENEQRWATVNRHERELREQINLVEGALKQVSDEKDNLWRVQTAQADAIKKFPRLWLEEVEKALAQDPNRRRQPALVPVPDEL